MDQADYSEGAAQSSSHGKRKAPPESTIPAGSDVFAWLDLPSSATLVAEGLPARAPVVCYDKQKQVFQNAAGMLQDVLADDDEVSFEHDCELILFPDVVDALNTTNVEVVCLCIAKCEKLSKWGVGLAAGWKGRQAAAKLALAIAIMDDDDGKIESLTQNDMAFAKFCAEAGLIQKDDVKTVAALHHPVLNLTLMSTPCLFSEDMSTTVQAVVYDEEFKDCFAIGGKLLWDLIGDGSKKVKFEDDAESTLYPEITEAIQAAGGEECSYCVAISEEFSCWGVGIATGWKNREKAARISLALALAWEPATLKKSIHKYKEFAELCLSAKLIVPDKMPPKRRKEESWQEDKSGFYGNWDPNRGFGLFPTPQKPKPELESQQSASWDASSEKGGGWSGKDGWSDNSWPPDPMQAMMGSMMGMMKGMLGKGKKGKSKGSKGAKW